MAEGIRSGSFLLRPCWSLPHIQNRWGLSSKPNHDAIWSRSWNGPIAESTMYKLDWGFYENSFLRKFGHIVHRTKKTHPTAKYAPSSSPKNTLRGTVFKNTSKYPESTCLFVDNISLGSPSYSWQWYRLTTDSGHETSAVNNTLKTIPVRIFFGRIFRPRFAVGLVFHVPCSMWTIFFSGAGLPNT